MGRVVNRADSDHPRGCSGSPSRVTVLGGGHEACDGRAIGLADPAQRDLGDGDDPARHRGPAERGAHRGAQERGAPGRPRRRPRRHDLAPLARRAARRRRRRGRRAGRRGPAPPRRAPPSRPPVTIMSSARPSTSSRPSCQRPRSPVRNRPPSNATPGGGAPSPVCAGSPAAARRDRRAATARARIARAPPRPVGRAALLGRLLGARRAAEGAVGAQVAGGQRGAAEQDPARRGRGRPSRRRAARRRRRTRRGLAHAVGRDDPHARAAPAPASGSSAAPPISTAA